jgi:Protein kinase domain/Repeat of unknown function (DUF346)
MIDYTGLKLGNYRLISMLGSGGFADVYLGEHIYLQTTAAIKVVHAQLSDAALEQFLVEARTIARLTHPNIVPVLEFGIEGNTPYLVMSYAPFGSLRQRHSRGSILRPREIASYVEQVASALQYAHDRQVVHCDVKPENMLLGHHEGLMLSDFGIAISPQVLRTAPGSGIMGTATYMAPEQFVGQPAPASDQYALGVVVYEWLCGEPPFRGTPLEVATQHSHIAPEPLRARVPDLSPAVESVVMQALAKDPQARFSSMRDFAGAWRTSSSISQRARPGASLHLGAGNFPPDGYVSHTVAVHLIGELAPGAATAAAPGPSPPGGARAYSRRALMGGLLGLTAAGLLTTLGVAALWHPQTGARTALGRARRKLPTARPSADTSATARALVTAAASRPAVTSSGPNSLELFIRGGDDAMWFKSFDGTWHPWESLGYLPNDPAVVSTGSGRLDMFVRGSDSSLQHRWFDGIWHPWETLGGVLTADPAIASSAPGRIDICARSLGNTIYYTYFDGSLHTWQWQGGISLSAPSVTSSSPGRIDAFVRGGDNALWYRWFDGAAWHDWASLGGSFTSDPSATSWGPGRLDVFTRGSDNSLQHIWFDGAWHPWETLGGSLTSSPCAVSWGPGRIDICARGAGNTLQHTWFDGAWHDWQPIN